jgi:hypothetical protein
MNLFLNLGIIRSKNSKVVLVIVVLLIVEVIFQLIYPKFNRLMPRSYLFGEKYSYSKVSDLENDINEVIANRSFKLKISDIEYDIQPFRKGYSINARAVSNYMRSYPKKNRLIPFSLFIQKNKVDINDFVKLDGEYLDILVNEIATENKPAVDASISIENDQVIIKDSIDGYGYDQTKLKDFIRSKLFLKEDLYVVEPDILKAEVSSDQLLSLKEDIIKFANKKLTWQIINEQNGTYTLTPSELLMLIKIEAGDFKFDETKIETVINNSGLRSYEIKSVDTVINIVNGSEAGRVAGKPGKAIDIAKLSSEMTSTVEKLKLDITASSKLALDFKGIPPGEKRSLTYSQDQAGLNKLVEDLAKNSPGTVSIAVEELTGQARRSNYLGSSRMISASTYKLFVAREVIERIESGSLDWSDPMLGTTLEDCFNKMIRVSNEACSIDFLANKIGYSTMATELSAAGYSSTSFSSGNYAKSTTLDQVKILRDIYSGSFLNTANKDKLISLMSVQIYRSGIPAGSPSSVADKPGFIDNALTDSAIVFNSKGTYLLSVYTENSSWASIANIAAEIDKHMSAR